MVLLDERCVGLGELGERESAIVMGDVYWCLLSGCGQRLWETARQSLALFDRPIHSHSSVRSSIHLELSCAMADAMFESSEYDKFARRIPAPESRGS